jgi:hypothetical protein
MRLESSSEDAGCSAEVSCSSGVLTGVFQRCQRRYRTELLDPNRRDFVGVQTQAEAVSLGSEWLHVILDAVCQSC